MLIDLVYIKNCTLNEDLVTRLEVKDADGKTENADRAFRMINFVLNKIRCRIRECQFQNSDGSFTYPRELQHVACYLFESIWVDKYSTTGSGGAGCGVNDRVVKSRKIDDVTITYETQATDASSTVYSFFGIPVAKEIIDILEKYECDEANYGVFGFCIK